MSMPFLGGMQSEADTESVLIAGCGSAQDFVLAYEAVMPGQLVEERCAG